MNSPEFEDALTDDQVDAAFERRMRAVSQSVEDYHSYLVDYLHRLTGQWQDAENLAQDLWRYVLLHFDEENMHALPLLRRKAYHLFVDHYRRQLRRGEVLSQQPPEQPAPIAARALTDEGEAELKERFWSEYPDIDLTGRQKEALWLHARYGYTCKEIENMLGVAASTVGDWLTLGRKQLADYLNNQLK